MDILRDVKRFHRKFGLACPGRGELRWPSQQYMAFRFKLLREEVDELEEAFNQRNFSKFAREAVDVVYVAVGMFVTVGLPFRPLWRAVHRANMRKELHPTEFRPVKPSGWRSPDEDIEGVVVRFEDWWAT